MKLLVIAALIALCSAGRLDHLEPSLRGYLPPSQGAGFGQGFGNQGGQGSHDAQGAFGGHAAHGAFGANSGTFGGIQAGRPGFNARSSFGSPSNQYLPPNQGFSASDSDDSVSVHGFGGQGSYNQQFGNQGPRQFGHNDASSQGANHFGAQARFGANNFGAQSRFQSQSPVSRQYLAPHSSQNIQQQPFNEQTGYQY